MDQLTIEQPNLLHDISIKQTVRDDGSECWQVVAKSGWFSQHFNYVDALAVAKEIEKHEISRSAKR